MTKRRISAFLLAFAMIFSCVFGSFTPAGHVYASEATAVAEDAYYYLWENQGTELVPSSNGIYTENTLYKNDGTITNGVMNEIYFRFDGNPVSLRHDKEWSVEWTATGGDKMMLLANNSTYKTEGNVYVYRNDKSIICIGFYENGGPHNYGLKLSDYDIDYNEKHTYRIQNELEDDGNMIYLYVDDELVGPMTDYYEGSTLKAKNNTYLSGKDFEFKYLGMKTYPLDGIELEYVQIAEDVIPEGVHFHNFDSWTLVTPPTADGPGTEMSTCECGETSTREVAGSWQIYDLTSRLAELPEGVCCKTNLWEILEHDDSYLSTKKVWNKSVPSVTIPINAGDKIYATSFEAAGTNGGEKNGIVVTFFDALGIAKQYTADETYAEFSQNGYLTAPEGSVVANIPMRTEEGNELYILNLEHKYATKTVEPTCTEPGHTSETCLCGDKKIDTTVPALGHSFTNYVSNNDATNTKDGTKTALCDNGCGAKDTIVDEGSILPENVIALKYDDRMDISGKTVEIIDAGEPTSYQVGYGIAEGTRDTAVVTIKGDTLVASGVGRAKVSIDGEVMEVRVSAAPISLLLLIGQSNMQGSEGEANKSIICEEGQVYATYGDRYKMTVANATNYAASALTGPAAAINVNGTTSHLSGYPIYALTEDGSGKAGPDSGFAHQWTKATGEKVWVVNAAHGGSSINTWQDNGANYEEAIALFSACQDTLQKEIAAGHFTLSHMGYFWCQGCTDEQETAEWYVDKFLTMHNNLLTELAFDADSNPATPDVKLEFANIILTLAGHEGNTGYRYGGYETEADSYFMSYEELEMRCQRVAQYWMAANQELKDINVVCNLGDSWVTLPDGSDSVEEYFASHYENGRVDYQVQVAQKESWYSPTKPADVKDSIHYNQIGYNEIGIEAARNALYLLGEVAEPEVETTVTFYNWTGFESVTEIGSYMDGCSDTLVVPVVSPCYRSKQVTYTASEGLEYNYYDLLDVAGNGGTLTASINGSDIVTVKEVVNNYLWENTGSELESVADNIFAANSAVKKAGTYSNNKFTGTYYQLAKTISLKHDKPWEIEWNASGAGSGMLLSNQETNGDNNWYLYRNDKGIVCIGYKGANGANNYGLNLTDYDIDFTAEHYYCIKNVVSETGNTLQLYVDDELVGPMTNYYVGSSLKESDSNFLSGKDFTFRYIGNSSYPLTDISVGYIKTVADSTKIDGHIHTYTAWEIVSFPTADAAGLERRSCTNCDYVQERNVTGVWQKYDLAEHLVQLPENVCMGTNIWAEVDHEKYYFSSNEEWVKSVPSVTIPVNGGDMIDASSFGEAGKNGGEKDGIVVTFFNSNGVAKKLSAAETAAEYSLNGYLTAPEGTIAVNVPMWSDSDDWKLYIINREHNYEEVVVEPTCLEKGYTGYKCISCDANEIVEYTDPTGHTEVPTPAVPATCTRPGLTEGTHCSGCNMEMTEQYVIPAKGHGKTELRNAKEATCTEKGYSGDKVCIVCDGIVVKGSSLNLKPHKPVADPEVKATCTGTGLAEGSHCSVCENTIVKQEVTPALGHAWDSGVITKPATPEKAGVKTYTCATCKETKTEDIAYTDIAVERIWGKSRYMTSIAIANELKAELGVDEFDTIIIASGDNFPDALAGSYLAAKTNAPILMVNNNADNIAMVQGYIVKNLTEDGKVYILGGSAAVPESIEKNLKAMDYDVSRLKGKNRYETNIAILEEAGVTDEAILVCTGTNFADSLSASASGLPILLVNPKAESLDAAQKAFLADKDNEIYIIGGEGAVSEVYAKALKAYDRDETVTRVKGKSRYETSIEVAKEFFGIPQEAIIAYASNYPDGLCGGPLAYVKKAPLVLTAAKKETAATNYIAENYIATGTALGGSGVLPDDTVKTVFGMDATDKITGERYE